MCFEQSLSVSLKLIAFLRGRMISLCTCTTDVSEVVILTLGTNSLKEDVVTTKIARFLE